MTWSWTHEGKLRSLAARSRDDSWLRSNPVAVVAARLRQEGSAGLGAERRKVRALVSANYPLSSHYLDNLGLEAAEGRRH